MSNYTFENDGRTYKTENAIRIITEYISDPLFGEVVEVVLWRTEDGLYYFTTEDIMSEGDFSKTVHYWATNPEEIRYWMRKNYIELDEIEDERVEEDEDLYEAIMDDLCPDGY